MEKCKKYVSMVLCLFLLFAMLVGCRNEPEDNKTTKPTGETESNVRFEGSAGSMEEMDTTPITVPTMNPDNMADTTIPSTIPSDAHISDGDDSAFTEPTEGATEPSTQPTTGEQVIETTPTAPTGNPSNVDEGGSGKLEDM